MNIITLTPQSHEILDKWLVNNVEYEHLRAENNLKYFDKFAIYFMEDNHTEIFRCFCEHKNKKIHINVKEANKQIIKINIEYTPQGKNDYNIAYKTNLPNNEQLQNTIRMISSDCLALIALFIYGNVVESKGAVLQGKSANCDKYYFIKEYAGNVYAVNSRSHRSPEGVFAVRGHFRKYKDGKIIWIDEFLKGVEK